MTSLPSDVLDGLLASGQESGGAVAVIRDRVLHLEHAAGTRDGTEAWALDTLVRSALGQPSDSPGDQGADNERPVHCTGRTTGNRRTRTE